MEDKGRGMEVSTNKLREKVESVLTEEIERRNKNNGKNAVFFIAIVGLVLFIFGFFSFI